MPYQRVNYFPGMSVLTNKRDLTERLNFYSKLFPKDYDFFPKTWVLKKNPISNDLTKTDTINTLSSTLAPKTTEETFEPTLTTLAATTEMDTVETSPPTRRSSIESPETSQDTDYIISSLESKLSSDTASEMRPLNSETKSVLSNSEIGVTPILNEDKTNKMHQTRALKPLRDITNQMDVIEAPNSFGSTMNEYDDVPSQGLTTEKTKDTNFTNERGEQFSKENQETTNERSERIQKRIITNIDYSNEMNNRLKNLGIKSNTLFQTNLRSTKGIHNNNRTIKTSVNQISAGQILLKNNVKAMVMQLSRVHQTNKSDDEYKENNATTQNTNDTQYCGQKRFKCTQDKTIKENEKDFDKETRTVDLEMNSDVIHETVNRENSGEEPKSHVTTESVESDPIYILKPCDGCQGKGIKLAMNIDQIVNNMEFDAMICQQYITNPLLWNGYKFDIRFYVLITSVKQLRVYIYNEGIVRLATEKYEQPNESNIDNMFMHLTNYAINKDSENFSEDLSKQSLEQMNRFLKEEHGVDIPVLYEKIHDIIVKTILTGYKPILREYVDTFKSHVYREACFQLLGFDIILDNQCNPYLLEINKNASLKRPTPIDKVVKTKLTRDLFSILNLNENRLRGDILRDNLNYNTYGKRYIEHEMEYRGDFHKIYPCAHLEQYVKYIID